MLFCQLAHADSLREICNGLRCCEGKLRHLGIDQAPNKSTLSYANEHRDAGLYEKLFYDTYQRFRVQGGLGNTKHRFRFKNKLLSLDSTTVSLCLRLFPWAKFRRAKGGVKVHVLLDHDHYMPSFVNITEAQYADSALGAFELRLILPMRRRCAARSMLSILTSFVPRASALGSASYMSRHSS